MRRTTDHGWVAKAYNVNEPTGVLSQTELDLFEDLSDCESLDSFFDDDFDVQTSEEKLGNLLSCNTLGVETKVCNFIKVMDNFMAITFCRVIDQTGLLARWVFQSFIALGVETIGMALQMFHVMKNWPD